MKSGVAGARGRILGRSLHYTWVRWLLEGSKRSRRAGLFAVLGGEATGRHVAVVDALTRISGNLANAGERSEVDQKASALLSLAK